MANSVKTGNGMTEYCSCGSGNRPLGILPGLGLQSIKKKKKLWAAAAEARDGNALCEMMLPKLYTAPLAEKLSEAAELMLAGVTDGDYDRFVTQAKAIAEFDIYDKLDQIRVPALVIGVENDLVVTGEASLEIAEKLGCDCHMYGSEYAHCVFDEDPGYKQILLDQLESTYRQHRTIQGARLAYKS